MTYNEFVNRLAKTYDRSEARAIARLVLEDAFGLSLMDIYSDGMAHFSDVQREKLEEITERLEKAEPVQYVLGEAYFCGHRFSIADGVLIPRPETEELVDTVVNSITSGNPEKLTGSSGSQLKIVDIGTGSGCIAISIALALAENGIPANVEGWDISEKALTIAKGNAEQLEADVTFRMVDILRASVPDGEEGTLNVIISNPPYICNHEAVDMERNVLEYEPHMALFVPDDDPLLFYRTIAEYGRKALTTGGLLAFEINRAYGNEVRVMLEDCGYKNVSVIADQYGNQRIVMAYRTDGE